MELSKILERDYEENILTGGCKPNPELLNYYQEMIPPRENEKNADIKFTKK